MDSTVAAALIALSGVILSVALSFLVSLITNKYNYNKLFAETVSRNRMEWINVWRENISIFLANARVLHEYGQNKKHDSSDEQPGDLLKEFYKAKTMITSRLNLNEGKHALMFAAINGLSFNDPPLQFRGKCEYIESLAREILKPEWERVKDEARGKHKRKSEED